MGRSRSRPLALVQHGLLVLKAGIATALMMLVVALIAGAAPTLLGFETYVVLSGSMEPALGVGDLAVVGPVRPEQLKVRDIISYRTPARPNVVITHRLVGISRSADGGLTFETRGDANDSVDQVEVDSQAVLGRVVYAVPKIGYLVDFARRPIGKALLLGVPAVLLAADALIGWRALKPAPTRPQRPADGLVRRAWVAQRNGRTAEALALLEQAIPLDPSFEDAWLLKAECYDTPEARLSCLWEGLAANPDSTALRAASDEAARAVKMAQEAPATGAASVMRPVFEHGTR